MPIYEYQCLGTKCGKRFERFRPVNFMDSPINCPHCGFPSRRLLTSANIDMGLAKRRNLRRKLNRKETDRG
jgi:putative FmdB family regulatory protein